jgi:CD63 antigen
MDCASSLVKYLMFIFNLIFALSGLALLVLGALYFFKVGDFQPALEHSPIGVAPILLIILGAIVFVIAFFGCCGAIRESSCMLTTYAIILLVIFIIQVALGVYVYLQIKDENDFKNILRKDLRVTFQEYPRNKQAKEAFDLLQTSAHCCGVDSYTEWNSNIPQSCCQYQQQQCNRSNPSLYRTGCTAEVYKLLGDNVKTIGIAALVLSATELLAAIFGLCLSSNIKNSRSSY